jgi:hypothetical protein
MPYQPHVRVRCNGVLGPLDNPVEIFSYGFAISNAQLPSAGVNDGILQEVVSYHARAATKISYQAVLTEVAISLVGADGKQIGDTVRLPTNAPGSVGSVISPPQVSYRVSLGDGTRDRSGRGGWYVPMPAVTIDTASLVLLPATADQMLASAGSLVQGINSLGGGLVCIASSTRGNRVVTRLRVGLALDTIRRRRSALDEAYRSIPVPA